MSTRTCALLLSIAICFIAACGGSKLTGGDPDVTNNGIIRAQDQAGFPTQLPLDALQPWETGGRAASAIGGGSEFTAGRDWFLGTGLSENGEAARLAASPAETSYGIWRIPLGGAQPGTLSIDANLLDNGAGESSEYYLGVANYGTGRWDWQGPYSDSHVRLSLAQRVRDGGSFLSSAQNIFVCLLASSGNSLDVVGLGLNPFDAADSTAPTQITGLTATPVSSGLELQWLPVISSDLAGYRIHYSDRSFINPNSAGVRRVDYLEGSTRFVLSGLTGRTYIRISALDHSGNASQTSVIVSGDPLAGDAPALLVTTDLVSGSLGSSASLSASGADTYDFDTNGDGIFNVTGNTSGSIQVDTSATGIIRPRVRAASLDGAAVALGSVSLFITGNSRPLASAVASPQSGNAPLNVTFTGTAEDSEDDASALAFAWDFDGDGIYESGTDTLTPAPQNYTAAGLFNAKFRVTDSEGASDVDTVAVQVTAAANQLPTAVLQFDQNSGDAPLTVSFSAFGSVDPDGNIVEFAWDWEGDGLYDAVGESTNASHVFTQPGIFDVKLRVEDNRGGRATTTETITVNVVGNDLPLADLTASPNIGLPGVKVTLDASASNDPDGSIASYEFDFDGDGLYDSYGETSSATHVYGSFGIFLPVVRVTDTAGAQSVETAAVDVTNFIAPLSPDSIDNKGQYTSLAVVDGFPAISYYDNSEGNLNFVRALNEQGSAWGSPIAVDSPGNVGSHTSLGVVAGFPAISYYDSSNGKLEYVRALNEQGSAWATPISVDSDFLVGLYTSLAVVDGNPAISYYDAGDGDLMYVRALDQQGASWNTPVTIDASGNVGLYTSLVVVDSYPAISYFDTTNDDLKYVRATDAQGTNWAAPESIDTAGDVGLFTSLAVVDGYPAISYRDAGNGYLKYARASNSQGNAWSTPMAVDTVGDVGEHASLAVVDGFPAISYYDATSTSLKYISALNAEGTAWQTPLTLDPNSLIGRYCSLAVVDGYPAISYHDAANGDLKYVIFE